MNYRITAILHSQLAATCELTFGGDAFGLSVFAFGRAKIPDVH